MGIMKSLVIRDKKKRLNISLFEEKNISLKSLKQNRKLGLIWWSRHKLSGIPKKQNNNRCIITGRGKSVNQSFKLSRLELRRWVTIKLLPGIHVGSW